MELNGDVLKSYLVSLGFSVDQPALKKFDLALKDAAGMVELRTSGILREVLKWQTAITGGFVAVSGGILGIAEHVAQADQKYRLFGLSMMMGTQQARNMQMALDKLGVTMEQAYWDPELHKRFLQYVEDQDKLAQKLGPGFESAMRGIRDLRGEFDRLELKVEYVAMSFVKNLYERFGPEIEQIKAKLEEWGDWVLAHMPEISDWFAKSLVPVLKETWKIVKDTGEVFAILATAFTNLVGAFAGDDSIKGTEFSFQKLAKAIGYCVGMIGHLVNNLLQAEKLLAHFVNAAALAVGGHFSDALKEVKAGFAELTSGSGAMLGAITGGGIGIATGGLIGGALGAALPIPGGTLLGESIGAHIGGLIVGGGTGLAIGGAIGQASDQLQGHQNKSGNENIAAEARVAAIKAGAKIGVDPRLIFEQWAHETGGFKNRGARELNNLGGVRYAGSLEYRKFASVDEYADFYADLLLKKRYQSHGISKATDEASFAKALKDGGYYEDSYDNYVRGMRSFQADATRQLAMAQPSSSLSVGDVNVYVTQPNASAEEIGRAVKTHVASMADKQAQRNMAQLSYAG